MMKSACTLLLGARRFEMKAFYNSECSSFVPSQEACLVKKYPHSRLLLGLSYIQCSIKVDLKAYLKTQFIYELVYYSKCQAANRTYIATGNWNKCILIELRIRISSLFDGSITVTIEGKFFFLLAFNDFPSRIINPLECYTIFKM